jgi:hypothetical protein
MSNRLDEEALINLVTLGDDPLTVAAGAIKDDSPPKSKQKSHGILLTILLAVAVVLYFILR